jgi:cysteine desulfurase
MDSLYLDNSASTPVLPAVWEAMRPHLAAANPASVHHAGRRARQALEDARERTAALLGAHPDEVIFTSGATEANNLALFGLAADPPALLLVGTVEHPCVIEPILQLQRRGFTREAIRVDETGVVTDAELERAAALAPRLAALMLANHETGAVQPVAELARRLPAGTALHCDAAAAAGKVAIDFHALGAATLTVSAHKFHGPAGAGALLLRRGAALRPQLHGGHQQQGRRPGTEAVALAVGLAAALDLATAEHEMRWAKVTRLRGVFLDAVRVQVAPVALNGPETGGLPHIVNLSFPGVAADVLLMNLDLAGVCCSAGAACSSGSLLPSPVLRAMGLPEDRLRSAVRFSFSHLLRETDVAEAAARVAAVVGRLRGY